MSKTAKQIKVARLKAQGRLIEVEAGRLASDQLALSMEVTEGDEIHAARLTGVGCPELLRALEIWRPRLQGKLSELVPPDSRESGAESFRLHLVTPTARHWIAGHVAILMRELILKARGEWNFPYKDEELCHCRAVATAIVDQAVTTGGCRTVSEVSRETSAGTSCGTCRPDIESILSYRLGLASRSR